MCFSPSLNFRCLTQIEVLQGIFHQALRFGPPLTSPISGAYLHHRIHQQEQHLYMSLQTDVGEQSIMYHSLFSNAGLKAALCMDRANHLAPTPAQEASHQTHQWGGGTFHGRLLNRHKGCYQQLPGPSVSSAPPSSPVQKHTAPTEGQALPSWQRRIRDWLAGRLCLESMSRLCPRSHTSTATHHNEKTEWREMSHSQPPPPSEVVKRCSGSAKHILGRDCLMIEVGFLFGKNNAAS